MRFLLRGRRRGAGRRRNTRPPCGARGRRGAHHVSAREAWLAKAFRETRPGARFVLVEFKEGELPEGPPERMKISRAELVRLMQEAGFVLQSERPELLPYQTFLVFARPDRK
ncbi:MAG: hypothetical protein HY901_31715 [Deltaproteobacteria bacterium]|nr:hypothetical protein [Deltaproteobacteria bacterium]